MFLIKTIKDGVVELITIKVTPFMLTKVPSHHQDGDLLVKLTLAVLTFIKSLFQRPILKTIMHLMM